MESVLPTGLVALLAAVAVGCHDVASPLAPQDEALPEFAAPRGQILDTLAQMSDDVIPYRALVRADFRGSRPPPHFEPYRHRLGAATCAYVVASPETRIMATRFDDGRGTVHHRAEPHALGYRALMDRSCSWWNTEQQELPPEYVLEHEQIHFALFELAARELDARAEGIAGAARSVGTSTLR